MMPPVRTKFLRLSKAWSVSTVQVLALIVTIMASKAIAQTSVPSSPAVAVSPSPTPNPTPTPSVDSPKEDADDLQTKTVEFEGYFRLDQDLNPNETGHLKYNLRTQRWEIQASLKLPHFVPESVAKQILLVVRTQMEQDVFINGILAANRLTASEYLKEAYVEFKKVGGLPIAVIMGTSEVSYGQDYHATLDYQSGSGHPMADPDQGKVRGFTVALDKKILPYFDKLEASFFTPDTRFFNLSLRHFDGFAFRVTKNLGKYLTTEVSILKKGNSYDAGLPSQSISFGGTYRKGAWTFWGEGFKLKNSQRFPDASGGYTAGASLIKAPGQFNIVATGIQKTLQQYTVGYELFLQRHWAVGPTLRYTFCVGGDDGCVPVRGYGAGPSLAVSIRYIFGHGDENQNPTWVGDKEEPVVKEFHIQRLLRHLGD